MIGVELFDALVDSKRIWVAINGAVETPPLTNLPPLLTARHRDKAYDVKEFVSDCQHLAEETIAQPHIRIITRALISSGTKSVLKSMAELKAACAKLNRGVTVFADADDKHLFLETGMTRLTSRSTSKPNSNAKKQSERVDKDTQAYFTWGLGNDTKAKSSQGTTKMTSAALPKDKPLFHGPAMFGGETKIAFASHVVCWEGGNNSSEWHNRLEKFMEQVATLCSTVASNLFSPGQAQVLNNLRYDTLKYLTFYD